MNILGCEQTGEIPGRRHPIPYPSVETSTDRVQEAQRTKASTLYGPIAQ